MKMMFFISLLLITLSHGQETYQFECFINSTGSALLTSDFKKQFVTKYTPQPCGCQHVPDGTIQFKHETSPSEMNITVKNNKDEEVSIVPTVIYNVQKEGEQTDQYSHYITTAETLALSKGKYKVQITLSYEYREYDNPDETNTTTTNQNDQNNQNGQTKRDEPTQTPPTGTVPAETTDTTAQYFTCTSGDFVVEIDSKIKEYKFNSPYATSNQKCSGNHGSVLCNLNQKQIEESIKEKTTLLLVGTQEIDGVPGETFENVPVGEYQCQLTTPYCTITSKTLEVKPKDGCTPIEEWLDYQLYGEGQTYFYIGFIIGAIALLLNIIMLICSFKLCCSAEGSVERLAEEMAAEYRTRHGVEMR